MSQESCRFEKERRPLRIFFVFMGLAKKDKKPRRLKIFKQNTLNKKI